MQHDALTSILCRAPLYLRLHHVLNAAIFARQDSNIFQELLYSFFLNHFLRFSKARKGEEEEEGMCSQTTPIAISLQYLFLKPGEDENEEEESADDDMGGGDDHFVEYCVKLHNLGFIVISEEIFTEILFDQVCGYGT